ncbi:hypothetical protein Moror_6985 [Moniliophthora roreri MCA 2997]|uniref:Mid2 domain-containing protein n=2 Tax=Moniliophthora roreri TaxID=221103 RepID=V2XRV2_MONRO|nr:hypothetical protein Moror_6985 [Moniliophthora roreri MCA 2997]
MTVMPSLPLLHYLVLFFSFCALVAGAPETRTIDDYNGDSSTKAKPTYIPSSQWNPGQLCTNYANCHLQPNVSLAHDGTWHDTTHLEGSPALSMQFSFIGVELSVFCILPNKTASAVKNYDLILTLDNANYTYVHEESQLTDNYQYNVSVFTAKNLANTNHTFTMTTSVNSENVVLFDYATYVVDPEAPVESSGSEDSTDSKTNLPAILGGVLGSLLFICLAVLLAMYSRKRRAEYRSAMEAGQVDPYNPSSNRNLPLSLPTSPTGETTSFGYASYSMHTRNPSGPTPTVTSTLDSSGSRSVAVDPAAIDWDSKAPSGPPPAYTAQG